MKFQEFRLNRKLLAILFFLFISTFILEFKYIDYSPFPVSGNWITNDQHIQVPTSYFLSKDGHFATDFTIREYNLIYPSILFRSISFFYDLTGNMFFVYAFLLLFLKLIYIAISYLLSYELLRNRKHAIFATFLVSFSHFMGAEEIGVSEVVPKNVVFPLMLILIYTFIKYGDLWPYIFYVSWGVGVRSFYQCFPHFVSLSLFVLSKKTI